MNRFALLVVSLVLVSTLSAFAGPPELDYQGKILVSDIPLTGPGYFKFAIANAAGTTNFWANDSTATGEPTGFITNTCYNGVFSTILGGAPTDDIDPDIFGIETSLFLRVWFSSDKITFNEMLPPQDLLSAPYAINADLLDGWDADEIIAAATNGVTLTGDISGTPGGGTTVDSLQGDAVDTGTPSSDEVLMWDGSAWTSAPVTAVTDDLYVDEDGDTMTGVLSIDAPGGLVVSSSSNEIQIGASASAANNGVAVGGIANGDVNGAALGRQANGYSAGAAVGAYSDGNTDGAAVGFCHSGRICVWRVGNYFNAGEPGDGDMPYGLC